MRLRKRTTPTPTPTTDSADVYFTTGADDEADGQDFVISLDPPRPTPPKHHGPAVMTRADIEAMFDAVFGKMPREEQ
jgi:hypothetical protein